jgi:hypothetical protein
MHFEPNLQPTAHLAARKDMSLLGIRNEWPLLADRGLTATKGARAPRGRPAVGPPSDAPPPRAWQAAAGRPAGNWEEGWSTSSNYVDDNGESRTQ